MAGKVVRWIGIASSLFLLACYETTSTEPPLVSVESSIAADAILDHAATKVVLPAIEQGSTLATQLKQSVQDWQLAVAASSEGTAPAQREAAQEAWYATMATVQILDAMQFGPLADEGRPLGTDLRTKIYSWPTVNACRVDQILAKKTYSAGTFVDSVLVNGTGLDALEYLLFNQEPSNSCSSAIAPNNDGTWDALGAQEIRKRRAEYAQVLASGVETQFAQLLSAWKDFALNSTGLRGFESNAVALDELFHAVFELDLTTKDARLGVVLGNNAACPAPCFEGFESQFAAASVSHVAANIRGTRLLFFGATETAPASLAQELIAKDQEALANNLYSALIEAETIALQYSRTDFSQAKWSANGVYLEQLFTAIQNATNLLKDEIHFVLGVEIPSEGAGDSD